VGIRGDGHPSEGDPSGERIRVFDPSPIHIVLLLLIVLLIFGTKRLPEIGRSLGRGIREFKGSVTGEDERRTSAQPPPASEPDRAPGASVPDEEVDRTGR
jgi:sec-independent protein translocase protein TatA